jgi:membrane-bound metal-dependent hydrolase YbcI (DUF457 family)
MYFLAHLLAGILLGILLAYFFQDTRLIPACALGSILPDLIDKPIGILLFPNVFGTGTIFGHTLLAVILVLFIGILVYTRYPRAGFLLLAVAAGIFTHQLLDAMWLHPINWFWPALGPFIGDYRPDFFWDAFWRTINNPTEWLAGGIILMFLIITAVPRYRERCMSELLGPGLRRLSLSLILVITATAVLIMAILIYYG